MSSADNLTSYSQFNLLDKPMGPAWGLMTKIVASHVIVILGLLANSLTFAVMKNARLRHKSYSHYLSALAVFDSLVLIGQEVHIIEETQPGSVFYAFSDNACKIFMFAEAVCNLMSSWLIVAMAMERLCVVYMPFRRNMWCQQRGAVIIIFSLFGTMSCTQLFRFVMVKNFNNQCSGSPQHDNIYIPLHIYVYQFGLLFITPVIIVIFCNVGVLLRIFSVEKATLNMDSASTRLTGSFRRRSKTTRMLVTISFTYIVTTLPSLVITMAVYIMFQEYGESFSETFIQILPWMHVLQAFNNINYASNFFIYIVSGKKFRIELRKMFHRDRGSSFTMGSTRTREEILMVSY